MTIREAINELKAQLEAEGKHKSHKVNPDALKMAIRALESVHTQCNGCGWNKNGWCTKYQQGTSLVQWCESGTPK